MLLLNNLRPSGEEVKAKNEKHLTRVCAPARWASVVNARQTNHPPLRCCRPRLHASVQDRRTRPHKRKLPAFAIWRHERKGITRRKNNFPTSKSAVYKRYCNFALSFGAARNAVFNPSLMLRRVFRLAFYARPGVTPFLYIAR